MDNNFLKENVKLKIMKTRNRPLDRGSRATEIRAIPLLNGIKRENITVKMESMPEIPDKPMTFQEIGELMDAFEGEVKQRGTSSPTKPDSAKERKQWKKVEEQATDQLKKTENEYDMLVRELEEQLSSK